MPRHTKERQYWTAEQEAIVRNHYANSTPQEMERLLNREFDTNQISHKAKRMGTLKSAEYKLKYGLSPDGKFLPRRKTWNQGMPCPAMGRASVTQFKPGQIPRNHKQVGSVRISKYGYIEIKTEEGLHKWRFLHREVWKQHHGEYPPPGHALIFKDGNRQNCNISNLQLITRKQLMQRNTIHNYPEEIKEIIRLKSVITRKINGYEKRHHRA